MRSQRHYELSYLQSLAYISTFSIELREGDTFDSPWDSIVGEYIVGDDRDWDGVESDLRRRNLKTVCVPGEATMKVVKSDFNPLQW